MRTLIKHRSVRALLTVVFFALILSVSIALAPSQQESCSAMPCYEVEHEYYSDATYTTQVGWKYITCSGTHSWGTVTIYKVSYQGDCCGSCCGR